MQQVAVSDWVTSMKYTMGRLIGTMSGSIVHLILVYLFVVVGGWGWTGICLATSLSLVARFGAAWLYAISRDEYKAVTDVHLFSKESCSNLGH